MVQMRPDFIDRGAPNGEISLFNLLRDTKGADNWIALHSLDIFGDIPTGQGEADMVVLIPGKGVLFVEVKSHDSVTFRKGVWRYNGEISEKGPIKQAYNAMYAVMKYLKSQNVNTHDIPFGFVAWLTGGNKEDVEPTPEIRPWMILDSSDLKKDIKATLSNVMDNWMDLRGFWDNLDPAKIAAVPQINEIASFLRPDFQVTKTSAMRIAELNASLAQALAQQKVIMELVKGKKSPVIISGVAGTGKTHIAIAEAKRAHQRGDRTLFLCFNKVLAKYLKQELSDYNYVEVHHIHSYMTQLTGQAPPDDNDSVWWRETLPSLAEAAIIEQGSLERFDCLIVDEAQDLCLDSYLDVLDLSLEKGLANSPSFFFGDFTHQAIYLPGDIALENLKRKAPNAFEASPLDVNCRNTKEIGDTIMQILKEPGLYAGYRRTEAGVAPTLRRINAGESIEEEAKAQLSRLAKTFPLEDIVILSSNKKLLENLVGTLKVETASIEAPKKGRVRWGTAQAFKGMEAAAILLVEFEDGASSRETFYISSTRSLAELACVMPAKVIEKLVKGI
jgi:hypothetical protein